MKDLVIHASTAARLDSFLAKPSHALILVGPDGSGKHTLAFKLAALIRGLNEADAENDPYRLIIDEPEGKSLGIDAIRQLDHFLSLKVPRSSNFNRYVLIDKAHLMTLEAQNALLKTLEEPPLGTFVILTASHAQSLLPTIRSRAQIVTVKRPGRDEVLDHFSRNYGDKAIQQAYAISGGLPGLMHALLDQEEHPLLAATDTARKLLSKSVYERLLMVDELAKQRQLAADTAFILQQMARVSLQSAGGTAAKKWQRILISSYQASETLASNANPKLVLDNLMLSL